MRALPLLSLLLPTLVLGPLGCAGVEAGDQDLPELPEFPEKADSLGAGEDGWLSAGEWEEIRARCAPDPSAPLLQFSDYRWDQTFEEMEALFWDLYASDKRLPERAYYDEERDLLILQVAAAWGGETVLPPRLIRSVRAHIEKALARGYVDFVFFPDMGHSHFFIPEQHWEERYAGRPVSEFGARYSEMFDDPELKILYHTAEQLRFMDASGDLLSDRHTQWRFYTRNPVGDNRGLGLLEIHHDPTHSHNTLRTYEGHRYYGAGFYVSASERGCFPFVHQGTTYYYDLSMRLIP
jgi:hypothetical protein